MRRGKPRFTFLLCVGLLAVVLCIPPLSLLCYGLISFSMNVALGGGWQGWAGDACDEHACVPECSQHGKCVDGKCVCNDAFSGDACDARIVQVGGEEKFERDKKNLFKFIFSDDDGG